MAEKIQERRPFNRYKPLIFGAGGRFKLSLNKQGFYLDYVFFCTQYDACPFSRTRGNHPAAFPF